MEAPADDKKATGIPLASRFKRSLVIAVITVMIAGCSVVHDSKAVRSVLGEQEAFLTGYVQEGDSNDSERGRRQRYVVEGSSATPLRTIDSMLDLNNSMTTSCPSNLRESDIRTTMVLQMSLDRVWLLEEHCRRWKDPIVGVVSLHPGQRNHTDGDILGEEMSEWIDACPQLTVIEFHLDAGQSQLGMDPLNLLRNVGLDEVVTSHVFVNDIDNVPSGNLHDTIRSTLKERSQIKMQSPDEEAIIVPVFERVADCNNEKDCRLPMMQNRSYIPHTYDELEECIELKGCQIIKGNNPGHSSTRTEDWLKRLWYEDDDALDPSVAGARNITWLKCIIDVQRYEPYAVLRWCPSASSYSRMIHPESHRPRPLAPYYDERFHG